MIGHRANGSGYDGETLLARTDENDIRTRMIADGETEPLLRRSGRGPVDG